MLKPEFVFFQITCADLLVFSTWDITTELMKPFEEQFPKLMGHVARVKAIPNIAAYLAKRAETKM